jgi:hypothetical protein
MAYNGGCHISATCDSCCEDGLCPTQNKYGQFREEDINKGFRRESIICPNCGKHYIPVLTRNPNDHRPIQAIFPFAPAWQREQLISGICSDECWDAYLGAE